VAVAFSRVDVGVLHSSMWRVVSVSVAQLLRKLLVAALMLFIHGATAGKGGATSTQKLTERVSSLVLSWCVSVFVSGIVRVCVDVDVPRSFGWLDS
jgi:hypothetical protein